MPYKTPSEGKSENGVNETHAAMSEAKRQLDELGHAFNEFNATLKEKADAESVNKGIAEIESKLDRIGDAMDATEEKVAKLEQDAVIRQTATKADNEMTPEEQRYYDAWTDVLRGVKGAESKLDQARSDLKTSDSDDGGHLVDTDLESYVRQVYAKNSSLRQFITPYMIRTGTYEAPIAKTHTGGGWGVEGATAAPDATTPAIAESKINLYKLWARPEVTTEFLQDTFINVREFIGSEIGMKFMELEGNAFMNGTGTNQPEGILKDANTVLDSTRDSDLSANYAKVGFVKTGLAGGFPTAAANSPSYKGIIDLQEALRSKYKMGDENRMLMTREIRGVVRKLTDSDHVSIWEQSLSVGVPSRLMGTQVIIDDHMPTALAAGKFIILHISPEAFAIVEKGGMDLLVDPYTKPTHVRYMASRRCGGGIVNYEALKLLKVAA